MITRIKRFFKSFRKEGRNRIDPDMPYGSWSRGFYPATMPMNTKK